MTRSLIACSYAHLKYTSFKKKKRPEACLQILMHHYSRTWLSICQDLKRHQLEESYDFSIKLYSWYQS